MSMLAKILLQNLELRENQLVLAFLEGAKIKFLMIHKKSINATYLPKKGKRKGKFIYLPME